MNLHWEESASAACAPGLFNLVHYVEWAILQSIWLLLVSYSFGVMSCPSNQLDKNYHHTFSPSKWNIYIYGSFKILNQCSYYALYPRSDGPGRRYGSVFQLPASPDQRMSEESRVHCSRWGDTVKGWVSHHLETEKDGRSVDTQIPSGSNTKNMSSWSIA